MKQVLEDLFSGRVLSVQESKALMLQMVSEPVNEPQVSACLAVFRLRGFTVDELDGFRQAVMELCVPLDLGTNDAIDVCGTGGDHKHTLNVSTIVAFELAALGKKVAKHGNYAVSSACGSSNLLEALGIKLSADSTSIRSAFERAGVCFLHAPLFHPALKRVAALRKQLAVRTVFNALGPLVNPARPKAQMNGVYGLELQRTYGYLLERTGGKFAVVHSLDGYDEVSLTAPCRVVSHRGTYELRPADFGLEQVSPAALAGGQTVQESADLALAVLMGRGTEGQQAVVAANVGLALWISEEKGTLAECTKVALDCVRSGDAMKVLELCVG